MQFRNGALHVGELSAMDLVERFGSPLYVYDAEIIERQARRIRDAFSSLPLLPFYAMKANGNVAILKMIETLGFGCDAVSPGEVFLAKRAGFTGDRIWFTCSNVSDDDLLALDDPSIVINVNSMSEVDRVVKLRLNNRIALRINPDVGAGHHPHVVTGGFGVKFGIDVAELGDALTILQDQEFKVAGIHAHIGSGIDDVSPLISAARTLMSLVDSFPDLQWVNFGGGISVPYRPGDDDFPIDKYGHELSAIVRSALTKRSLTAIIEPGRYVVAESGVLLATVTAKKISAGFEWIGCDTGFNHLARPSKYGSYHHIVNATKGDDSWLRTNPDLEPYDSQSGVIVAGNICESGDVFTRESDSLRPRRIAPTKVGDLLAFCDVGAYGFSMASHYNARLLPAEVLVRGDHATLVRKRQTYDDLLH